MRRLLSKIFGRRISQTTGDPKLDELFTAACHGDTDTLGRLHAEGIDIRAEDDFPLRAAAWHGQLEAVSFLLQNGADPNARDGEAVRVARERCHDEVVKLIEGWSPETTPASPTNRPPRSGQ